MKPFARFIIVLPGPFFIFYWIFYIIRTTAFAIADERERPDDDDNDLFHFISYIPFQGAIYELDGLKEGPVYHGLLV